MYITFVSRCVCVSLYVSDPCRSAILVIARSRPDLPQDVRLCVSRARPVRATHHEPRRKPLNVKEVGVWSAPPVPRAQVQHGVFGESEKVTEDAHQEADQLCVGGEAAEVVRQTQEQEVPRQRRQRRQRRV